MSNVVQEVSNEVSKVSGLSVKDLTNYSFVESDGKKVMISEPSYNEGTVNVKQSDGDFTRVELSPDQAVEVIKDFFK
jgi:histidinol-phosphate/aromatic aminotransferase/cobyric acid decarboxylase-like protein